MFNLDDITNESDKGHNKKWPYVPNHPYRFLILWIRKNKCIA